MTASLSSYGTASAGAINSEHQVQVGLLRALCDAIRTGADAKRTREIFDQVVDHSAAHFMSEQLLMRLCSYPDYDDHVLDHDHMMEVLCGAAARLARGDEGLALNEAHDMLVFLSRHIATRDQRFVEYYLDWSRQAAPQTPP